MTERKKDTHTFTHTVSCYFSFRVSSEIPTIAGARLG